MFIELLLQYLQFRTKTFSVKNVNVLFKKVKLLLTDCKRFILKNVNFLLTNCKRFIKKKM